MTDKQIRRLVRNFTLGILENHSSKDMCFVVCNPLQAYLQFSGIDCELTEGTIEYASEKWHHYWITTKDGRIIDPTADQFVLPKGVRLKNVWLEEKPEYYIPKK